MVYGKYGMVKRENKRQTNQNKRKVIEINKYT